MSALAIPTTDDDLSQMLKENFGWCWPPYLFQQEPPNSSPVNLPHPVLSYFRQLDPDNQQQLLRFKDDKRTIRNVEELEEIYRRTWTIRWVFLETINRLNANDFIDDSPTSPQFYDDNNSSELFWLRLMDLLMTKQKIRSNSSDRSKECKKKEDYPVHINFTPCHPLQSDRPIPVNRHVQVESIKRVNVPDDRPRYWTVGFQDTTSNNPKLHDLCFQRKNPFPNIMISNHIGRLGHIWIEKSRDEDGKTDFPTKKYRVLFQKTCSDLDLGLFLWPQFHVKKIEKALNLGKQSNFVPDTPKIPIYQDNIIELCDQDRLLLFTTEYRSHRVFIDLQISVEFCWASDCDEAEKRGDLKENEGESKCEPLPESSVWIDNLLQWPNPCERYSHYVKVPSSYPDFDVIDEGQDVQQATPSGIVISHTDEQESPEQITIAQTTEPMETNRDTSSNACLFKSTKTIKNQTKCKDKAEQTPTATTHGLLGPTQVKYLTVDSSENPLICNSDPTFSPRKIKILGDKYQDSQTNSLAGEKQIPEKQIQQRLKSTLRQGKENNSNESKKLNSKGKSSGNEKSVKRKSPRLIEMSHSHNQQLSTSKRKRI
ncbi:hypothetical protein PGT21_029034 [Puccinia graminis f. sp. tritici]|uniref:Uncharacterized protein n=1 Tax=Puccinia graminis f. sp. tritici TaxID=56615 RepID=A0A5B0QC13_PUCGR|nr:hypothetical protein PGT21_029034 [Puccinia graminis f. sp. tritici]